jgi:hypothetical protein
MLHVAEIERSMRVYELLGFTTIDTDRCVPIGWVRLHFEDGSAVTLRSERTPGHSVTPVPGLHFGRKQSITGRHSRDLASNRKPTTIASGR